MSKVKINIKDLFNIPTAEIYNPDSYKTNSDVCIDSRKVKKGTIFFAIKGEKLDGHKFIKDALKNGASTIVINKNRLRYFDFIDTTIVTVKNTTIAYGDLANLVRRKANYKVISISGSNGKTTTKEMLSVLLSEKYNVVKTEANNNNHIGVPMTIFSAKTDTEILVLEHGTNHFGEIDYTAKIAQPDYALLTNIGNGHLEFLENTEKVYEEKATLFEQTLLNGGKIFVNNDDKIIRSNSKKLNNKIFYGLKGNRDFKGRIIGYTDLGYPKIRVEHNNKKLETIIPFLGEANAKNFLSAVSIALMLSLKKKEIQKGIKKLRPIQGRLNPIVGKNSLIIDDTYNSNPESVKAAVKVLKKVRKYKKKILLLGDMFELGKSGVELHKSLANMLKKEKKITVLLIGKLMKELFKELINDKPNVAYFSSRKKLNEYLGKTDFNNVAVLVKGSRGMKMEAFVAELRDC